MSKKNMRELIPEKFYKGGGEIEPVIVSTVGELISVLKELPKDLPINQGYSDAGGAMLTVYNIDRNAHLSFEENED